MSLVHDNSSKEEITSNTSTASSNPNENKKVWRLGNEEELRIETKATIAVTLNEGSAEVFGTELLLEKETLFSDIKFSIFTWHGAVITIVGSPSVAYTDTGTPMISYINSHAAIEDKRSAARAAFTKVNLTNMNNSSSNNNNNNNVDSSLGMGPRTLIVGSSDSGKSSLSKILLNYAVRAQSHPLFVDLDVGLNSISIPGSIAATSIEQPIEVNVSDNLAVKAPIVYYFGHPTPNTAPELFIRVVDRLADSVNKRLANVQKNRTSGVIINTGGYETLSNDLIVHIANTFSVDIILVVGHDRLFNELKSDKRLKTCKSVAKLLKSGGVVSKDGPTKANLKSRAIKQYFYGQDGKLCPHQKVVLFRDLEIFKVGGGPAAPSSTLPLGAQRRLDPNRLMKVSIGPDLLHSMAAVVQTKESATLLDSPVSGFVYISGVDPTKKSLELLTPSPGPLPSNFFHCGLIKWIEV